MSSSGLRENGILTKVILTTYGTKIYVEEDMVLRDGSPGEDHTYQSYRCQLCASSQLWLMGVWSIVGWQQQGMLMIGGRGVLQDLIPDVGQLELAYAPIKGWSIDPDVYGLLDDPGNALYIPTHYGETVHTDVMT